MAIGNVQQVSHLLRGQSDPANVRKIADMAQAQPDAALRHDMMLAGTAASPFFIPHASAADGTATLARWLEEVARARQSAASAPGRRILVAAPMKTGSTFIVRALSESLRLPTRGLSMLTASPYDFVQYGAGLQAFRIDELALISQCLAGPFVAHHHIMCSPHLAGLLEVYDVKPILVRRNIFDCLVSLDEFYLQRNDRPGKQDSLYFNNGLPFDWVSLDPEVRMAALLDRYLQFYIDYYVSWTKCEQYQLTRPLWISYEHHVLSDRRELARKISDFVGGADTDATALTAALTSTDKLDQVHFNKGVAGRGRAVQGANRDRVLHAASRYKAHVDWRELLD